MIKDSSEEEAAEDEEAEDFYQQNLKEGFTRTARNRIKFKKRSKDESDVEMEDKAPAKKTKSPKPKIGQEYRSKVFLYTIMGRKQQEM